jgi:hypothetical protein
VSDDLRVRGLTVMKISFDSAGEVILSRAMIWLEKTGAPSLRLRMTWWRSGGDDMGGWRWMTAH